MTAQAETFPSVEELHERLWEVARRLEDPELSLLAGLLVGTAHRRRSEFASYLIDEEFHTRAMDYRGISATAPSVAREAFEALQDSVIEAYLVGWAKPEQP